MTAASATVHVAAVAGADLTSEFSERVRAASAASTPLRLVGGDTKRFYGRAAQGETLSVASHTGVLTYDPTELVLTARAGTRLVEIEALLDANRQMLAFEPPRLGAASTIGGVVAAGLSGPRRPFAGAVRDSVLGVRVMNGAGEALRFGGEVLKNVAGFDLFRPMAGGLGVLGLLLDVSLRVVPRPQAERAIALELSSAEALVFVADLMRRPTPLGGAFHDGERLHLRLSGGERGVAAAAQALGGQDEDLALWDAVRDFAHPTLQAPRLWRLSLPATAPDLGPMAWDWGGAQRWLAEDRPPDDIRALARAAGGHVTLFRGAGPGEAVFEPLPDPLMSLHQRLRSVFDPAGVFNPGRMYEGL